MVRSRGATSVALRWLTPVVVLLAIVALLAPQTVLAQAVSGTLLGTVKDSTGAVVAGAKIKLTHNETGTVREVATNAAGDYTAPLLPVGTYTVSCAMTGFKGATTPSIRLGVDQKVRTDLTLEVGALTETVTLQAEAPLVSTSTSDFSATIAEAQIQTLPLNGRNFINLARTIPGVVRGLTGTNIDGAGSYAWRASASVAANGMRVRDNTFLLDGVDNNESWINTVVIYPSIDALEEFKVQTSTYSAEFGRSAGAVINLQIKSGTNNYHGSVFEFLRDDSFDANDPFNKAAGRSMPPFKQNQFGATFGGPIQHNKLFFFTDYQGARIRQGLTRISTVPSLKMREGDLSEIRRVIYNPATGLPYANNFIPKDTWDRASRNIVEQLYPLPNAQGTVGSNGQIINNYVINPELERQDDQFDIKSDYNVSGKNRLTARYSYTRTHRFLPANLPRGGDGGATGGAGDGYMRGWGLAINDTHSFNSSWLNEFRFGFTSASFEMDPLDYGTNLGELMGIDNINNIPGFNLKYANSAMPQIIIGDVRNLGANNNQPLRAHLSTMQFFDNVIHIRGRHTFKLGASLTLRRRETYQTDTGMGVFGFNSDHTSNCAGKVGCVADANTNNTGLGYASFLLGYPSAATRNLQVDPIDERKPEIAFFIQDDIRVGSRLTLNLGLRYDLLPPYQEVNDLQSNFDPGAATFDEKAKRWVYTPAAYAGAGRFLLASPDAKLGDGTAVGRRLMLWPKNDISPRVGFAYDISGKGTTILRGGYGVFYNDPMTGTASCMGMNPPFIRTQAEVVSTFIPTVRLSEGLSNPPVDLQLAKIQSPSGDQRSSFDPRNYKHGRAQQWNLNVQQQIGKAYLVEVAYVGSAGRNLNTMIDINQAPPVVGVTNPDVNRPYAAVASGLRATRQNQGVAWSDYHALTLRFNRRAVGGLSFYNSYTFGKATDVISDTEWWVLNSWDLPYSHGRSDNDIRHVFTSNWIYDLPFGKGGSGTTGKLLSGWQLSGILLVRSGLPFTVWQSSPVRSTGTGNRPNRIGSGKLEDPTVGKWFDASAFVATTEPTGTYGNSGRNILDGPGQFNIDLSIIKVTKIGCLTHELRLEAFNVLNHPQFSNPGGALHSFSGPGGVTIGNAAVGTIPGILPNSTMRQIQLGMKLRF